MTDHANVDLNGLFEIQQNYLTGLSQQTDDPELTKKVSALQTNLTELNKNFKDANLSSNRALTHQDQVSKIVTTEKDRLLEKKQIIDNALVGKQRAISLNDSFQQKQSAYNNIKIVWIFALALIVLFSILQTKLDYIPSIVFSLGIITILVGVVLYSLNSYIEIRRREKVNYNSLDLPDPTARSKQELDEANKNSTDKDKDLLAGINLFGCVGQKCCSSGTIWDNDSLKCVFDDTYDPTKVQETETFITETIENQGTQTSNSSNFTENLASECSSCSPY